MRSVLARVGCSYLLAISLASPTQAAFNYRIRLSASEGGGIVELSQERYVASVLAGEVGRTRDKEALKAMAVAVRTYAAHFHSRHATAGFDFCSTTHCQRLVLKESAIFETISEATHGQLLWYQSMPIFATYSRDCGGRSEAGSVLWADEPSPYLRVHPDPYCRNGRQGSWSWRTTAAALTRSLSGAGMNCPPALQGIVVLKRSLSGRAETLSLVGSNSSKLISASTLRFAIGRTLGWNTVRSDQYEINSTGQTITFEGRGQGHGVGLCQDGAAEMATEGFSFRQILDFYYPGTTVSRLAHDTSWNTFTTSEARIFAPDLTLSKMIAAKVDSMLQSLSATYRLAVPSGMSIYVYPDMDSFRNGTGEPGWVAAHTVGNRIELQPFITLQQHGGFNPILRHELLHVLVEGSAIRELPLWFREGLVECLSEGPSNLRQHVLQKPVDSSQITARADRNASRMAYASAKQRVWRLLQHYGTGEVLRWLKSGIPDAALRSSRSNDVTNSR